MQRVVHVHGVLKGLDREAECEVTTWKERSSSGRVYTRCKIVDEPGDLPEGPYSLTFAGYTLSTRKFDGSWMLSFLPPWVELERAA